MGVLACFHFTHFNIFGVIPFIFLDVYRTGLMESSIKFVLFVMGNYSFWG
ncbi:hypothetical protein OMAG_001454 [Candidatus Omnitrophus magneticus]|uniref:Uncharacterized protein n=1 Tax=Candidatus Omnitrophus magneticus TaxID=1609969 RepID=A0A0F0CN58_9BACT|nr:hypothetical protein OMAG_002689 [Candidatus Omnitrophus magneticus]KJJ84678.1 hypothetical protein OMAG_001454 [Candidatus Omnitrophus magneticus]